MKLEKINSEELQDLKEDKILKLLPKKEQSSIAKGIALELIASENDLASVDKNKSYHATAIQEMDLQRKRLEYRIAILREILNHL